MPEVEGWLAAQPKLADGKVDITLLIAEAKRRGYCLCPIPMAQMIDFKEFGIHSWCNQPYMDESWEFWFKND